MSKIQKIIQFIILFILFFIPHNLKARIDHLIITEIQIAGINSSDEFIKIYNPLTTSINLENYKITKKTSTGKSQNLVTKFSDISIKSHQSLLIIPKSNPSSIEQYDYMYTTKNSIASNNSIHLLENDQIVDSVGFGSSTYGETTSIPNPKKFQSVKRKKDSTEKYIDTDNNHNDFLIQENSSPSIDTNPEKSKSKKIPNHKKIIIPQSILINEIYSNPKNGESKWIELYNNTNSHLTISEVFLHIGPEKFFLPGSKFRARDYLIISNIDENLDPRGEILTLKFHDIILDEVIYGPNNNDSIAPIQLKGTSLARKKETIDTNNFSKDFQLTQTPTKSQKNSFSENVKKEKIVNLNIIKSKGKILPNHKKEVLNDNVGEIIISNNSNSLDENSTIQSRKKKQNIESNKNDENNTPDQKAISYPKILISELLPNPKGTDTNEWIELYNPTDDPVNLNNWILDDEEKQSQPFKLTNTIIESNKYLKLNKNQTNLVLNNTSDSVRLFSPDKKLIDHVSYDEIKEGHSYARNNNIWQQTSHGYSKAKGTSIIEM